MHPLLTSTRRLAAAVLCAVALTAMAAQAQDNNPHDNQNGGHGGPGGDHGQDPGHDNSGGHHGQAPGHGGHDGHPGYNGHWDHNSYPAYGYRPGYGDRYAGSHGRPPMFDRSRAGWWHGDARFVEYRGVRPGYYFAPGYGYYPVPLGYGPFIAGVTLPVVMRHYVVIAPTVYGLRPPPPGYGWFYAGSSFVLASVTTGVITRSVVGGW